MRILIIGGTRFIGPHVVHQLVNRRHDVAVFHRGQSNSPLPETVAQFQGDRNHLADHAEMLRKWQPDIVLDMIPVVADRRSPISFAATPGGL